MPGHEPDPVDVPFLGTPRALATDLALALPRGVEEAGRNVVELLDFIPGVDIDLPEERLLGRPKTGAGGIATGIAQFAAGFFPIAGPLGRLGLAARAGLTGAAAASAEGLIAGVATDLLVFNGHEQRLSNLVEAVPGLRNPITEFLAAEPEDSTAEARIKGALEGAVLGVATDLLIHGLRSLRAYRRAAQAGASPERAAAEAAAAAPPEEAERLFTTAVREQQQELAPDVPPPRESQLGQDYLDSQLRRRPASGRRARNLNVREFSEDVLAREREATERALSGTEIEGEPFLNPRQMSQKDLDYIRWFEDGRNVRHLPEGSEGAIQVLKSLEAQFVKGGGALKRTVSDAQQRAQAARAIGAIGDLTGGDPKLTAKAILASAGRLEADITQNNALLSGFVSVELQLARNVRNGVQAARTSDEAFADLAASYSLLANLNRSVSLAGSAQGRGLRALRTLGEIEGAEAIAQRLTRAATPEARKRVLDQIEAATRIGGIEGAAALARLAEAPFSRKALGVVTELFINSILSSAKTLVVNTGGGLALTAYLPIENLLGGAVTANSRVVRQSLGELRNLALGFRDAFALSKRAAVEGEAILTPGQTLREDAFRSGVIRPETFGVDPSSASGAALTWLGRVVRLPTSLIRGTDEFIKQVNFRTTARTALEQQGYEAGLRGTQLASYVEDNFRRVLLDGEALSLNALERRASQAADAQSLVDPVQRTQFTTQFVAQEAAEANERGLFAIADRALERGREATLQSELPAGSFSRGFNNLANEHPLLRLVVPFIRTPINIARFAAQRVDFVGGLRIAREHALGRDLAALEGSRLRLIQDFSAGGDRASEAWGRLSAGLGFSAFGYWLATSGVLTGRGPTDPAQRRVLEDAGWLPYAVRVTLPGQAPRYVQYQRLDPFATFLGFFADVSEVSRLADRSDQGLLQRTAFGVAVAASNQLTQKTFLLGIQQFVDAVSDPSRNLESWARGYAGALVPNAIAQGVSLFDADARDVNTIIDRVRSRIPGLSPTLGPVRNLLGEPISRTTAVFSQAGEVSSVLDLVLPIAQREVSDDEIRRELATLQHGFEAPPKRIGTVDLLEFRAPSGQTAHDRWHELIGQVKVQGRTFRQELRSLIRSSDYQALTPNTTAEFDSPRVELIRGLQRQYRARAYEQLLREFPQLRQAQATESLLREAHRASRRTNEFTRTGTSLFR